MERDEKGLFAPGNPGGPGRPKGSRSKLSEAYLKALADDFQEHGLETIIRLREEKPEIYIGAIGKLMPKLLEITGEDGGPVEWNLVSFLDVSPEQLET